MRYMVGRWWSPMDEMKRFLKEQRDLERYLSDASKAIKAADSGLLEALKYSGSALEAASKRTLDELSATGIAKRYETSIKDIAVAANSLGQAQVDGLLVPHAELVDTIASLQSDGMFKHRMPLDHEVERLIDELQRSQLDQTRAIDVTSLDARFIEDGFNVKAIALRAEPPL